MTTKSLLRNFFQLAVLLVALVMATSPLSAQEGDVKVKVRELYVGSNQPSVTLDASTRPTGDYSIRVVINGRILYMTRAAADIYAQIKELGGTFKTEADVPGLDDNLDANDKPVPLTRKEAYELYMAAYDKLTSLMSEENIDAAAAQKAYQEYRKAKDLYEASD